MVWTWKAEGHGQDEPDEAVLTTGVKPAAHQALQDLLTAWVSRLLPGYAVTQLRQKRSKGAPQKWEMDAQLNVLLLFNELRDELVKIDENEFLFPKQGESRIRFLRRMSRIVERLNRLLPQALRTRRNKKAPQKPLPKGFQGDTAAWDELCQWETRYVPLPRGLRTLRPRHHGFYISQVTSSECIRSGKSVVKQSGLSVLGFVTEGVYVWSRSSTHGGRPASGLGWDKW